MATFLAACDRNCTTEGLQRQVCCKCLLPLLLLAVLCWLHHIAPPHLHQGIKPFGAYDFSCSYSRAVHCNCDGSGDMSGGL
jgi:hypothetical protein